ncbi:hypothetical protein [Natronosalvus halobius]|uniref:hypothetical protein n=1 Tax=Natronosalvus halobius TaxID=2953746 RepID=UPI00209FE16E|nr:hypothetical protein [Natronosalvus halobius]USZ70585.1 hypothetical protein NGM15_10750 [Natronosalvus halobius]
MQGSASRAGLVILLVILLAGCSAFGSGVGDSDREPYGVDEPIDPEPPEPDELLPGLTSEGVTSSHKLAGAHASALSDRHFSLEQTTTRYRSNGSVAQEHRLNTTGEADGPILSYVRFDYVDTEDEASYVSQQDVWHANETYLRTRSTDGSVHYDRAAGFSSAFLGVGAVQQGLDSMKNVSVARAEREGETYYVLESSDLSPDFSNRENASMRAVVHEEGYVASFRWEYQTVRQETFTEVVELSTARVGDPDLNVTAPEWLEDAKEATRDEQGEPSETETEAEETGTETET